MRRWFAAVLAVAWLAVGCGNDDHKTGGDNATQPTGTTQTSNGAALPGEQQDIYPYEGAKLAVVGVAANDTLKVRSGPGTEFHAVFELPPTAMNAIATGHNRSLGEAGYWSEITVEGRTGWADRSFLLQPGEVNDITAEMFPTPPERPTQKTMLELGQHVARVRAGQEPVADIVVVESPTVGDVGEITVDIVGVGDESVGGERLKIFAEPGSRRESFTVRSVEATTLCRRGVAEGGLCV